MKYETKQKMWKEAEVSGTSLAPSGPPAPKSPKKGDFNFMPKSAHVNPRINVESLEPPTTTEVKTAARYALPFLEKYPLDSFDQVKEASDYFTQYKNYFSPELRREYCVNLTKRAEELGVKVASIVSQYGSNTYGAIPDIDAGISSRRHVVQEEHVPLLDKIANVRPKITPSEYAELLSEFDKQANIHWYYDADVVDPYLSTYGVKIAEDDAWIHGNETVYHKDLKCLAETSCEALCQVVGKDFVKEFKKDPISLFNSMPVDIKKIIGRMAQDAYSHKYSV